MNDDKSSQAAGVLDTCSTDKLQHESTPTTAAGSCGIQTRNASEIFALGHSITEDDAEITGSRLPTALQVLRCLVFHIQNGYSTNKTKWDCSKLVFAKIQPFYEKANVPLICDRKACEKILKLHDDNSKLRQIPKSHRGMPTVLRKVQEHEQCLSKTFPLWPLNAEEKMKNLEDIKFLQSMKTDRIASFGGFDSSFAKQKHKSEQRKLLERQRQQKAASQLAEINATATFESSSDTDPDDTKEAVDPLLGTSTPTGPRRKHRRVVHSGTEAFIPHNIMKSPKLVALATRMKMTPSQQAAFTEAFVHEAGG